MFANFEDMQRREQAIRENTIQNKMMRAKAIFSTILDDETVSDDVKLQMAEAITEMGDAVAIATGMRRNQQQPKPSIIVEH